MFDTSTPLATGATSTVTTPIPILYGVTTSTADCYISAVRCSVMGAASFPSERVGGVLAERQHGGAGGR